MNTNLNYAFYTENFEIYKFQFKTYGHGIWYLPETTSYDEAIEIAKKELYAKVQKDNPHLVMIQPNPQIQWNDELQYDGINKRNHFSTHEELPVTQINGAKKFFDKIKNETSESIAVIHSKQPEKTNKGTIEEQIRECTELDGENGLLAWKLVANSTPKLKKIYDEQFIKITKEPQTVNQ